MVRSVRVVAVCVAAVLTACVVSSDDGRGGRAAPASTACGSPMSRDWQAAPVGAATFEVNRATRGMTSRVRWMLAPDSSALLVMDDPAAVENDAIPNGLLFATERTGRVFRMDSVWSAAPSPDWRRLAIGRGVVLSGGEAQTIPPESWGAPAARLRAIAGAEPALVAESLRAHAFPVSGMAVVEGAAVTLVADVEHGAPTAPIEFVALDGWRVRWSCDGADILVGGQPGRVQDDAPSATERRVSSAGGDTTSAPVAAAPEWIDGPTLDISAPATLPAPHPLAVRGRVIEHRAGRIVVRERPAGRPDVVRDVGPGVALAATRGGHFILAVAPRTDRRPHESPERAIVYRVP
ncbi:MAG: hypothetical protein ACJ8B6_10250 [Gemmatimonadales bacterium]